VDEIRIPVAGDPFYAAAQRNYRPEEEPHCCYEGLVYLGRLVPTPDGDKEEVRVALEEPDLEYPGRRGRIVAERTPPGTSLATKVVYNLGLEDELIVVTAERGRPVRRIPEGD
jgi:hypothetical protein